MHGLLPDTFPGDEGHVAVVDAAGGRTFTHLPFDHLVFTGSTRLGREILKAAAEKLAR